MFYYMKLNTLLALELRTHETARKGDLLLLVVSRKVNTFKESVNLFH